MYNFTASIAIAILEAISPIPTVFYLA